MRNVCQKYRRRTRCRKCSYRVKIARTLCLARQRKMVSQFGPSPQCVESVNLFTGTLAIFGSGMAWHCKVRTSPTGTPPWQQEGWLLKKVVRNFLLQYKPRCLIMDFKYDYWMSIFETVCKNLGSTNCWLLKSYGFGIFLFDFMNMNIWTFFWKR